jgi:hypothetical protein
MQLSGWCSVLLISVLSVGAACASPRGGSPVRAGDADPPNPDGAATPDAPAADKAGGPAAEVGATPPPPDAAAGGCVARAEICDGQDNDCDGQRDEGLTTESCNTPCGTGERRCVNGRWDDSTCPKAPSPDDPAACGLAAGTTCARCPPVANARPVCNLGTCGFQCADGYLQCTTGCAIAARGFEPPLGSADFALVGGAENAASGMSVSTARAFEGTRSLAIQVRFGGARCGEQIARLDWTLCGNEGEVDVSGRVVSLRVFIDGPPIPERTATLDFTNASDDYNPIPAETGRWIEVSHRFTIYRQVREKVASLRLVMNPPQLPGATGCESWQGTLYIDDVRIP